MFERCFEQRPAFLNCHLSITSRRAPYCKSKVLIDNCRNLVLASWRPYVISRLEDMVNPEPDRRNKEPIMLAQNLWFPAFAEIISRTFFSSAFWFGGT